MSEKDLEKKIKTYSEVAKENPNVDTSMLMMSALKNESGKGSGKSYRLAYLVSLGVPPFGLLFAVKYFLSDDESDKQAAVVCAVLTLVSILAFYILYKIMFSSTGASVQQLEQIKPKDIQQLVQ